MDSWVNTFIEVRKHPPCGRNSTKQHKAICSCGRNNTKQSELGWCIYQRSPCGWDLLPFPAREVTHRRCHPGWTTIPPHLCAPQNRACKSRHPPSHSFWPDQPEIATLFDLQRQKEASEHLWLELHSWNVPCSDCFLWFLLADSGSLTFAAFPASSAGHHPGRESSPRAHSWLLGIPSSASVCFLVLPCKD